MSMVRSSGLRAQVSLGKTLNLKWLRTAVWMMCDRESVVYRSAGWMCALMGECDLHCNTLWAFHKTGIMLHERRPFTRGLTFLDFWGVFTHLLCGGFVSYRLTMDPNPLGAGLSEHPSAAVASNCSFSKEWGSLSQSSGTRRLKRHLSGPVGRG